MSEQSPDLPPGAEQIGPLLFLPMEEPPGEEFARRIQQENPPRFWMEEQTGALAEAVETYMGGERLTPQQLELLKLYLRQYVERAVLAGDAHRARLLKRVEGLRNRSEVAELADQLAEVGAEPF